MEKINKNRTEYLIIGGHIMHNDYTNEQICTIYRNQENRSLGVKILSQLTGWTEQKIEGILIAGGYTDVRISVPRKIDYDLAMELYRQGLTDAQIGDHFNVDKIKIRTWRRDNGLPSSYLRTRRAIHCQIGELLNEGYGPTKIAKMLGLSLSTVYKWKYDNYKKE